MRYNVLFSPQLSLSLSPSDFNDYVKVEKAAGMCLVSYSILAAATAAFFSFYSKLFNFRCVGTKSGRGESGLSNPSCCSGCGSCRHCYVCSKLARCGSREKRGAGCQRVRLNEFKQNQRHRFNVI